jgi:uncharacterized protein
MTSESASPVRFDASFLHELACPACRGDLHTDGNDRLICAACRRAYPIVEGIPVLISERAEHLPGEDPCA